MKSLMDKCQLLKFCYYHINKIMSQKYTINLFVCVCECFVNVTNIVKRYLIQTWVWWENFDILTCLLQKKRREDEERRETKLKKEREEREKERERERIERQRLRDEHERREKEREERKRRRSRSHERRHRSHSQERRRSRSHERQVLDRTEFWRLLTIKCLFGNDISVLCFYKNRYLKLIFSWGTYLMGKWCLIIIYPKKTLLP